MVSIGTRQIRYISDMLNAGGLPMGVVGGLLMSVCATTMSMAEEPVLDEIVVTAQKREQNLQDVPISITAFGSKQIQDMGMRRALDVGYQVPGVVMKSPNGDNSPIFTVRGIGLTDFTASNNSATSVYVDQVVKPYYPMVNFSLFDIERVEVLKGPQGTLYGRNNTGGAVRFISHKPSADPDGFIRLDYGNFNTFEVEGAIGGPIAESLLARLSVYSRQRSRGYQYDTFTGKRNGDIDRLAGRAAFSWHAADNIDVDFTFYAGRNHSDVPQFKLAPPFEPGALPARVVCAAAMQGVRARDGSCVDGFGQFDPDGNVDHIESNNVQGTGLRENGQGGSMVVNWGIPGAVLTSVTGFDHLNRVEKQDFDGTPLIAVDNSFTQGIDAFSQELRIAATADSSMQWIGGLFYSKDRLGNVQKIRSDDMFGVPQGGVLVNWTVRTESYAAFGQNEVPLTDRLSVVAGLRYTHEMRTFAGGSSSYPTPFLPTVLVDNRTSVDDLSGKLGFNYKLSTGKLLYVSASKGFKSGGFNGAFATNPVVYEPYGPERLFAYEAGFKSDWLSNRLRFNAALYHYDWRDFQATITSVDPVTNLPIQRLSNAGNAKVDGVEAELHWRPTAGFTGGLSAAYSNGRIVSGQLDGLRLANSPKFSLNGTSRIARPISALGGEIFMQTDFSYRTKYNTRLLTASTRPLVVQDAFWLANGRIGITTAGQKLELAGWIKNIFDERYLLEVFDQGTINTLDLYAEPRTYGVSVTYKFF